VVVRFTPAEHDEVVRQAREAGLAAGAWLGNLAACNAGPAQIPSSWQDLLRELLQLRVELARVHPFGDGWTDDPIGDAGYRKRQLAGRTERLLDRLDELIEKAGRRSIRVQS
jgi:hypothetical protein